MGVYVSSSLQSTRQVASWYILKIDQLTSKHWCLVNVFLVILVAQRLGRRIFDQAVAGTTPGWGVIK